jgi:hypothetical protein
VLKSSPKFEPLLSFSNTLCKRKKTPKEQKFVQSCHTEKAKQIIRSCFEKSSSEIVPKKMEELVAE